MGRRFLCFVSFLLHPLLTMLPCSAPFFLKLNEASEEQSKQTEKYCRHLFFWGEWVAFLSPHVACNQAVRRCGKTLCGGYWQPKQTVNFHFINAHLSLHFPFRYLFIYFHICATWKGLRDLHIFHSHFSFPVRHLHFRYSCSSSCSHRWISLFSSLGRKIKCKANFSLFAWGTWRKNAKIFSALQQQQ